jgi:glucose-1-phosphate adenylyltransferase
MANMSKVFGLIFSNMHDITLNDLTKLRTMGSVPFGARYRMIDFPLSNMVNAGINDVGVITKSNYLSLLDHLGGGDEWDLSRKTGGLHLLPPYGHAGGGLYRGRLEAFAGIESFLKHDDSEYVLMTDCDVVANMDYRPIIKFHEMNMADVTIVYARGKYTQEQAKSKTVLGVNDAGLVYDVQLRPSISGEFNTSLNIYVMRKDFLLKLIAETASRNLYSFEVEVLQRRLKEFKIMGYRFDGVYLHIDGIQSYFNHSMDLMDRNISKAIFNKDRPIYTKVRDEAPAKYGIDAKVNKCLIADGCIIEGEVTNSILFRGVKIGKGAVVRNCILMQDTDVGDKAELQYIITDKNVKVGNYRTLVGTGDYPVYVSKGSNV